jgi:hypothetical protein
MYPALTGLRLPVQGIVPLQLSPVPYGAIVLLYSNFNINILELKGGGGGGCRVRGSDLTKEIIFSYEGNRDSKGEAGEP